MNNPIRTIALACALFGFAVIVAFSWSSTLPQEASATVAAAPVCANSALPLQLIAKAAFAKDLTTGRILYQKDSDAQLPLASITKLATIATVSDILTDGDTVTITAEALKPEAGVGDLSFRAGEKWDFQNLVDYTLITSANNGAHALALAAAQKKGISMEEFIALMNQKMQSLGLTETFLTSDTGLDVSSTTAGGYGSARDIATLIASLVTEKPRLLEGTHSDTKTFTSLSGITHDAENTSDVIGGLDGAVASKTGYTDLAGGNLAIVFEPLPGRPVAAVVLGSTREGRDLDMKKLAAASKTALKRMLLCQNGLGSP